MRSPVAQAALLGFAQAMVVGWVLHDLHAEPAIAHQVYEAGTPDPFWHYVRDSLLAVPAMVVACYAAIVISRRLFVPQSGRAVRIRQRLVFAGLTGVMVAAATVVGSELHTYLFGAHHDGLSTLLHAAGEAIVALRYAFAVAVVFSLVAGVPGLPGPTTVQYRLRAEELRHAQP